MEPPAIQARLVPFAFLLAIFAYFAFSTIMVASELWENATDTTFQNTLRRQSDQLHLKRDLDRNLLRGPIGARTKARDEIPIVWLSPVQVPALTNTS